MIFEEKTVKKETIYEGKILNLRRDVVQAVGGQATREVIEHNGAVAMVAITDEGNVILIRQYRYPMRDVILEIPAGKIDKGESDPDDAAVRELKEETGYSAGRMEKLGKIYPSVGYSEEGIVLYLCRDLVPGETDMDEDEAIEIEEHDFDEACSMAENGEISDAKTVCALLMARAKMRGE